MGTCQRCRTYVRQQDSAMQRDATAKIFHNRARSMSASAAASFHLLSTHSITCPLSIHTRICSPLPPFLSLIFHCSPLYISHTELNVAQLHLIFFSRQSLTHFSLPQMSAETQQVQARLRYRGHRYNCDFRPGDNSVALLARLNAIRGFLRVQPEIQSEVFSVPDF